MGKITNFIKKSFKNLYDKKYKKEMKKKVALKQLIGDLEKKVKTLEDIYKQKNKDSIKNDLQTASYLLAKSKRHLKTISN